MLVKLLPWWSTRQRKYTVSLSLTFSLSHTKHKLSKKQKWGVGDVGGVTPVDLGLIDDRGWVRMTELTGSFCRRCSCCWSYWGWCQWWCQWWCPFKLLVLRVLSQSWGVLKTTAECLTIREMWATESCWPYRERERLKHLNHLLETKYPVKVVVRRDLRVSLVRKVVVWPHCYPPCAHPSFDTSLFPCYPQAYPGWGKCRL